MTIVRRSWTLRISAPYKAHSHIEIETELKLLITLLCDIFFCRNNNNIVAYGIYDEPPDKRRPVSPMQCRPLIQPPPVRFMLAHKAPSGERQRHNLRQQRDVLTDDKLAA